MIYVCLCECELFAAMFCFVCLSSTIELPSEEQRMVQTDANQSVWVSKHAVDDRERAGKLCIYFMSLFQNSVQYTEIFMLSNFHKHNFGVQKFRRIYMYLPKTISLMLSFGGLD